MNEDELMEISTIISSVFSLDQSDMDLDEIVRRLKKIGAFINRKSSREQFISFKEWVVGILKNRYEEEKSSEIEDFIKEISEIEAEDIVSNLGKNIEKGFKKVREEGKAEERLQMARNMIEEGLNIDIIIKVTGLERKVVEWLMK